MTNEEAIKILKGAIKKPNTEDGYMGQALDMAIKSLEQIKKIKSIINDPFYFRDMPVYFEADVLKYKAICEVLGCKTV